MATATNESAHKGVNLSQFQLFMRCKDQMKQAGENVPEVRWEDDKLSDTDSEDEDVYGDTASTEVTHSVQQKNGGEMSIADGGDERAAEADK